MSDKYAIAAKILLDAGWELWPPGSRECSRCHRLIRYDDDNYCARCGEPTKPIPDLHDRPLPDELIRAFQVVAGRNYA